jgi:trehalose 6-phosphate phosphatase
LSHEDTFELADPLELAALVAKESGSSPLLVATDFDGTLAPVAQSPGEAILRDDARRALEALARRAHVAVVSGRELSDLQARVGLRGITLAGEHGGDLLLPGGERQGLGLTDAQRNALEGFGRYAELLLAGTGGEVERKRLGVAAHTRRIEENAQRRFEETLLYRARELASAGLAVLEGKRVVELRPGGASKGEGLRRIRELVAPASYVLAIGDDQTDEELFREAIREGGRAVKVGLGDTIAQHRIAGPEEVARLLEALASPARSP